MSASPMPSHLYCISCSSAKLHWTWKTWGWLIARHHHSSALETSTPLLHAGARRKPGFPTETQINAGCCGRRFECALWSDWLLWTVPCWQPGCCCAKDPANWMPLLGKMDRAKGNSILEISLMSWNLTYPLCHPGTSVLGRGWVKGRC